LKIIKKIEENVGKIANKNSSKIVTRPKKEPQHSEIREKKRREIVNIMKKIGMPWTKKTNKKTSNFGGKKTYNLWRFF